MVTQKLEHVCLSTCINVCMYAYMYSYITVSGWISVIFNIFLVYKHKCSRLIFFFFLKEEALPFLIYIDLSEKLKEINNSKTVQRTQLDTKS